MVPLSKVLPLSGLPAPFVLRRASRYSPSKQPQPGSAAIVQRVFCRAAGPSPLWQLENLLSATKTAHRGRPHLCTATQSVCLMIKEGLGESSSQELSQVVKPPQGAQERWAAGETWRTSTVLCKYIYRMELFLGPWGPFPELCGRNWLPSND